MPIWNYSKRGLTSRPSMASSSAGMKPIASQNGIADTASAHVVSPRCQLHDLGVLIGTDDDVGSPLSCQP